jgi:hypothetical protein
MVEVWRARRVCDAVREMEGMRGRRRVVEVACVTHASFGRVWIGKGNLGR